MKITIKEIMEQNKVSQAAAQGLMTYLRETKQAEICGQVEKAEGTKGKKANIFEVQHMIAHHLGIGECSQCNECLSFNGYNG